METKKVKGIITSIRGDKKGVMVFDKWYTNKFREDISFIVGDLVEIEYYTKGAYHNYTKITKVEEKKQNYNSKAQNGEIRHLIDAGNTLNLAVQLVIAHKYNTLKEACDELVIHFNHLASSYLSGDLREEPNQGSEINSEGEYE